MDYLGESKLITKVLIRGRHRIKVRDIGRCNKLWKKGPQAMECRQLLKAGKGKRKYSLKLLEGMQPY